MGAMRAGHYKLLLLDLDGTLLGRDGRVSPRVARAVGVAAERLDVSIATGREPEDVLRFARQLGLTAPQMSDNGALVLDPATGKAVWSSPLGAESSRLVAARLRELQLAFLATHPGGTLTAFADNPGMELTRISALDLQEGQADRLVEEFSPHEGLEAVKVFLPYNGMWAVDFTRAGVNKATGALKLAELAGVDAGQIIAAGDSYNDLPLLQASGLRIAMADAPDELKAVADYVAPTVDEDGLAVAIEEFILPRVGG